MKAALISEATNQVVNIIELEKDAKWEAPAGHFIKFSEAAHIGTYWNGEAFVTQNPAEVNNV